MKWTKDRKAVIPETGEVIETTLEDMPTIVITSNHEQDLPAPFIRRCVYHYIEFPNPTRMREILRLHHPDANEKMVEAAITVFYQLRDLGLQRKPSTSEIIDEGYQTLVKHKDDLPALEAIREKGIDQALAEIQAAGRGYRRPY